MLKIDDCPVTAIALYRDLLNLHPDLPQWPVDPLNIDGKWLSIALEAGHITGAVSDYRWVLPRKVDENEGSQTHSAVIAINAERKIRYQLQREALGSQLILMKVL